MSEQFRDTDDALERVLRWRADRARPIGLLDDIQESIDMEPRPRTRAWWPFASTSARLAWLLMLFALLAVVAGGAALAGARLDFWSVALPPGPSTTSQLAVDSAAPPRIVWCDKARNLPFASSGVSLTGTWTDQSLLYYFRQDGTTVWGEATFAVGRLEALTTDLRTFHTEVFHGTVAADGTVRLDWSDLGAINPTDVLVPPIAGGTIVLRLQSASDGNAQLVSLSETGAAYSGPGGSSDLVFSPCTPAYQP